MADLRIAVVADDLTGALDAVAPFANAGLRCVVATGPSHLAAALAQAADILAVSTGSRELAEESAIAVSQLVAEMLAGVPQVIKKIDSRLKGHVGAEVAVLARLRGLDNVLICPAIPEMGRIVSGGLLRGIGVAQPVRVADSLSNYPWLQVQVPDAKTDLQIDDMLAVAGGDTLLVGARGLTASLARRMAAGRQVPGLALPHPVGFAIGSRDPITLAQVEDLRRVFPDAVYLAAPNGVGVGPTGGEIRIMQAVPGAVPCDPAAAAAALADGFVRQIVPGCASLVLTGGETAAAVLDRMQIGVLRVLGEAEPGLPLCQPLDFPDAPLILTKSGGFGAYDVLSRLI
ncbi:MAG: four-carbon acid sugar kinase family protein [bacterium]